MIQFGNECLKEAKRAKDEYVTNDDVGRARRAYSEYLIRELDDEIHASHPRWMKLLDVLRRVHTVRFSREDFEGAFEALNTGREGYTVDTALEVLYRYGIVGFAKIGGGGGGSAIAFSYKHARLNFDPAASAFTVHPGLKEALDLVEASEPA
jgi:hypothetical protein